MIYKLNKYILNNNNLLEYSLGLNIFWSKSIFNKNFEKILLALKYGNSSISLSFILLSLFLVVIILSSTIISLLILLDIFSLFLSILYKLFWLSLLLWFFKDRLTLFI